MNIQQLIALYTKDQRQDVVYPDAQREVLPNLIRHVSTAEYGEGTVIYTDLDDASVDAAIRQEIAYFEEIGQSFEGKVYDYDTPPKLHEHLAAHGFEVEAAEAIMVLDVANAPPRLLQPVPSTVQRITSAAELSAVQTVAEAVWQEDFSGLRFYLANALQNTPNQMSIYVAFVGDEANGKADRKAASAAWIYFPEQSQFASLWGGSTLAGYRGQGLYTALLAVRVQEAKARGVSYLTVDASPMSQPILEKFGFVKIAESYPCKWEVKTGV